MKKTVALFVLICAVFSAQGVPVSRFLANDDARQALYGALDKAAGALKRAPFGKKPVAILPLRAGHSLLVGRLKNMLVKAGAVCVEGKEDPMWDEILKEIEWDERKDDILDADTIVKFGKLKAAKILFQCEIRVIDKNRERVYAEIELRATEIATKRVIWGGTFAHRYYMGKDVQGIVRIDDDIRALLLKNFEKARQSLTAPQVFSKFGNIKTVVVVPLSGDIDDYLTQMTTAMLTQTRLMPLNPHIPSLTQIRATARDGMLKGDAVLYGSVRALHKTFPEVTQVEKKIITKRYVVAEIQLFIEEAKTGNILWGTTVSLKEPLVEERDLTPAELKKYRKEKFEAIPDAMSEMVADNWKTYLKIIGLVVLGVILLTAVVIGIKAFFSYNDVR